MALEVIREIVGFGDGLVGRLLMIDARAMRFETLTYGFDADNPLSGTNPTIRICRCTRYAAVAGLTCSTPRPAWHRSSPTICWCRRP